MKNPMTVCPACHAEMAKNAKACPHCGAKNKKPIFKKWWFWLLIVIILGIAFGGGDDTEKAPENNPPSVSTEAEKTPENDAPSVSTETEKTPEAEPITYTHYNVTELFDALESNALKAEKTFQNQHVELEGYVSNIDSDGDYISIGANPDDYEYFLDSIQCYIKTDEQLEQVLDVNVKDPIVIRGKIIRVGEVLGYSLDIHSIN